MRVVSDEAVDLSRGLCPGCGRARIAYVPSCRRCGASWRSAGLQPVGLTKPSNVTRIAHVSDLHLGQRPEFYDEFDRWLRALPQAVPDVLVVSGDVADKPGNAEAYARAAAMLKRCGIDHVVVPGNHDSGANGLEAYAGAFGREYPRVETLHGVDLLLLDSNAGRLAADRGPVEWIMAHSRIGNLGLGFTTEGRVGNSQRAGLSRLLAPGCSRPRVLVLHHHLVRQLADPVRMSLGLVPEDTAGTMHVLEDADAMIRWCEEEHVDVVLHGHKHAMTRTGLGSSKMLVLNGGSITDVPEGEHARIRLIDVPRVGDGSVRRVIEVDLGE